MWKILVAFLLTVALDLGVLAQPQCSFPVFDMGKTIPTGNWPWRIAQGDFNNDGHLDLVNTNNDSDTVSVHLGNGGGSFQPRIDSLVGLRPTEIVATDYSRDGSLDLVVATNYANVNKVNLLTGNGQGNFSLVRSYPIYNPLSIQLADFNNDTLADIVIASGDGSSGQISIFLAVVSGGFQDPIIYNQPTGVPGVATGDFDSDGIVDLILSESATALWKGDGTGHFAEQPPFTNNYYGNLAAGKFNGDQFLDIVMIDFSYRILLFTGSGNGSFVRHGPYPVGDIAGIGIIRDVNGDGFDDILTPGFSSNEMSVVISNGNNTFRQTTNYTTSDQASGLAIGDFNEDGYLDAVSAGRRILVPQEFTNYLRLTFGGPNGTFVAPINYPIFRDAHPNAVEIADVNNDGRSDVITANASLAGISVFLRTGHFRFAARRDFVQGTYLNNLVVEDVDRNGTRDIVAVGGNNAYVLLGNGEGNFVQSGTFVVPNFAVAVGAADINRDGDLDLIVGSRDGSRFATFLGNGNGTFGPGTEYTSGSLDPVVDVGIGDFNGDGNPDLAIVYDTGLTLNGYVRIWTNQGNGTFVAGATYSVGISIHPNAIAIGDLNDDGNKDFVVTTDYDPSQPSRARAYLGSGNGSFSGPILNNVNGWHANDVVVEDFNADGRADIATANDGSEDVSIFEGLGNGSLLFRQNPSAGEQARRMASGNLNGDTSPDLVVVNYEGSSFTMLPNGCNRLNEPESSAPFDFDGDGKTDIGIARNVGNKEWWINRSTAGLFAAAFGVASDVITPADFTGDGKADIASFRPSSGEWYVLRSEDLTFYAFPFGANGDVPVPGDFDGDGKADATVFRPSNSTWYQLLSGGGSPAIGFGAAGDKPVVADYDGDGKSDIAIFRPSGGSGSAEWWMLRSTAGLFAVSFGSSTDKAVPGDYTGDGKADVAFWRPSSGDWYVLRSENLSFYAFPWGGNGDIPAPGDYDGDGKYDAAVFRSSEATWYINRTTGTPLITAFGANGDRPIPNAFVP